MSAAVLAMIVGGCGGALSNKNETAAIANALEQVALETPQVAPETLSSTIPTASPTPSPTPKAGTEPGGGEWAGHYEGQFDGGKGSVTIMANGGTRYRVDGSVAGGQCSGEFGGEASPRGNSLTLRVPTGADPAICIVTLTRNGRSLRVSEADCTAMHGMSCGFIGTARFKHPTDTLEPSGDTD